MSAKKKEARTFEEGLGELEETLAAIESGELGLEETLEKYEGGVGLYRELTGLLKSAEEKVAILTKDLDGVATEAPLDLDEGE